MSRTAADLRIGLLSARSAFVGEDGLWADAGLGRLADHLAAGCRSFELALCAAPSRKPAHDHRLERVDRDRFTALPNLVSLARGFAQAGPCRQVVRELEARNDVLLIQLPFAAPLALTGGRTPRVYHLCADVLQQARTSTWYGGLRRLPALAVGHFVDRLQRRLVRAPNARAATNGEQLRSHYGQPPGRALVSTTMLASEILSVPRRRPAEAPFQVLFVGYLRHEKGIDVLIEAFRLLLDEHPEAELVIVGGREVLDRGMSDMLGSAIADLEQRGRVAFLGHQQFGEELFGCYADADVLALPSRNEGTPRVLVEARALGCPVVASAVGGIPTSIEDGVDGLLVPAGDADALATALRRIASDATLRRRLIDGGIERARRTTVEDMAATLLNECRLAVGQADRADP